MPPTREELAALFVIGDAWESFITNDDDTSNRGRPKEYHDIYVVEDVGQYEVTMKIIVGSRLYRGQITKFRYPAGEYILPIPSAYKQSIHWRTPTRTTILLEKLR